MRQKRVVAAWGYFAVPYRKASGVSWGQRLVLSKPREKGGRSGGRSSQFAPSEQGGGTTGLPGSGEGDKGWGKGKGVGGWRGMPRLYISKKEGGRVNVSLLGYLPGGMASVGGKLLTPEVTDWSDHRGGKCVFLAVEG